MTEDVTVDRGPEVEDNLPEEHPATFEAKGGSPIQYVSSAQNFIFVLQLCQANICKGRSSANRIPDFGPVEL